MPEALNYNGEVRVLLLTLNLNARRAHQLGLQFLIPWARLGKPHPDVLKDEVCEKMWDWLSGEVRAFEASQAGASR